MKILQSHQTKPTVCPNCRAEQNGSVASDGSGCAPEPRALTVCADCLAVNEYGPTLELLAVDEKTLSPKEREDVEAIRAQLRKGATAVRFDLGGLDSLRAWAEDPAHVFAGAAIPGAPADRHRRVAVEEQPLRGAGPPALHVYGVTYTITHPPGHQPYRHVSISVDEGRSEGLRLSVVDAILARLGWHGRLSSGSVYTRPKPGPARILELFEPYTLN